MCSCCMGHSESCRCCRCCCCPCCPCCRCRGWHTPGRMKRAVALLPHHRHVDACSCAGSHIIDVGRMASCSLSSYYELRAYTKCTSWAQTSPTTRVKLALVVAGVRPGKGRCCTPLRSVSPDRVLGRVVPRRRCTRFLTLKGCKCTYPAALLHRTPLAKKLSHAALLSVASALQDCSIDVLPIADPACADPTSSTGYGYGTIQMRAYYKDLTTIRSLLQQEDPRCGEGQARPGQAASQVLLQERVGQGAAACRERAGVEGSGNRLPPCWPPRPADLHICSVPSPFPCLCLAHFPCFFSLPAPFLACQWPHALHHWPGSGRYATHTDRQVLGWNH